MCSSADSDRVGRSICAGFDSGTGASAGPEGTVAGAASRARARRRLGDGPFLDVYRSRGGRSLRHAGAALPEWNTGPAGQRRGGVGRCEVCQLSSAASAADPTATLELAYGAREHAAVPSGRRSVSLSGQSS